MEQVVLLGLFLVVASLQVVVADAAVPCGSGRGQEQVLDPVRRASISGCSDVALPWTPQVTSRSKPYLAVESSTKLSTIADN